MTPSPRLTLARKIFLGAAAVVGGVLASTLLLTSLAAAHAADAAVARGLGTTRRLVDAYLDGRRRGITNGALVFVQHAPFRSLVMQRAREDMLDQAIGAAEQIGATWVQITDADGVRLARSDDPAAPPEVLAGTGLIDSALGGRAADGVGVSGDSALFQAVAVPIATPGGSVAGTLMAARVIDSSLVAAVKEATAGDVVFYALDAAGRPHVAASSLPRSATLAGALARHVGRQTARGGPAGAEEASAPIRLTLDGVRYVGEGASLRSAGGAVLGGYVALRSRDAELAPFASLRRRILLAGALGMAVAVALSYALARSLARPVRALADAARRASQGDYAADIPLHSDDEIGSLADAVRAMLADLRDKQALVDVLSARQPPSPPVGGDGAPELSRTGGGAASGAVIAPGRTVAGRYEVTEVLGAGGMGTVWKAVDRELDEVIAIKALSADLVSRDPTALERFRSEIRLTRRISHRNVVRTHDIGEVDGVHFITMEYVEGTPLDRLLATRGRLPVAATLAVGKQLCRALEVAHEQGVIHRDIKPANLLLQPDGLLKVMDFGIARLAQRTGGMTRTGTFVGTPDYMAPEQIFGEGVDTRADLYAAGAVLYECLTGRLPVEAETFPELLARLLRDTPPPPHTLQPDVPVSLSELLMRTLSRDRDARPASAGELHDALARIG